MNKFIPIKIKEENVFLNFDTSTLNTRKMNKIAKKILKSNIKNVVLSKKLQENKTFFRLLNSNNINIFDGRWLEKYLAKELVQYIVKEKDLKKEELELAILINQIDDTAIENIKMFSKEFKRVNIITNHINKLKKIEEDIYDEFGIMITVGNNKKKSLKNAKIILNIDFTNETINKYNIYDEAIIINLDGDIKINKKRFNGININNYEIQFENYKKNIKFYNREIFESQIYKRTTFENIRNEIKKANVVITELIGNNGIIKFT